MEKTNVVIPFGQSADNDEISISFSYPFQNHCLIIGQPGTGKSTLIEKTIKYVVNTYNESDVVVWTNFDIDYVDSISKKQIINLCEENQHYLDCEVYFIDKLYNEVNNRMKLLYHEGVSSYTQVDTMPLLIAVCDDFYPLRMIRDYECYHSTEVKLNDIVRMSHAVGVSLIIASQMPTCMSDSIRRLFNNRVALRSTRDIIVQTLEIHCAAIDERVNVEIERLVSSGKPGEFILFNDSNTDRLISGHVRWC